jgi:hypothetical protein
MVVGTAEHVWKGGSWSIPCVRDNVAREFQHQIEDSISSCQPAFVYGTSSTGLVDLDGSR